MTLSASLYSRYDLISGWVKATQCGQSIGSGKTLTGLTECWVDGDVGLESLVGNTVPISRVSALMIFCIYDTGVKW